MLHADVTRIGTRTTRATQMYADFFALQTLWFEALYHFKAEVGLILSNNRLSARIRRVRVVRVSINISSVRNRSYSHKS